MPAVAATASATPTRPSPASPCLTSTCALAWATGTGFGPDNDTPPPALGRPMVPPGHDRASRPGGRYAAGGADVAIRRRLPAPDRRCAGAGRADPLPTPPGPPDRG